MQRIFPPSHTTLCLRKGELVALETHSELGVYGGGGAGGRRGADEQHAARAGTQDQPTTKIVVFDITRGQSKTDFSVLNSLHIVPYASAHVFQTRRRQRKCNVAKYSLLKVHS